MIKAIEKPSVTVFWVARKMDNSIVTAGVCNESQVTETGLDILESYITRELAEARLSSLGVKHTDKDSNSLFFGSV